MSLTTQNVVSTAHRQYTAKQEKSANQNQTASKAAEDVYGKSSTRGERVQSTEEQGGNWEGEEAIKRRRREQHGEQSRGRREQLRGGDRGNRQRERGEIDRKTGRASEDGNNRKEERSTIAKRRGGQSQGAEGGNRKEERAAHKKL